jgi:protein-L-isoaspartate(D-aspartate) O-methyltransferase
MRLVDRAAYCRDAERGGAYLDCPQGIGYGATISAPHMHALALKTLEPYIPIKDETVVLDVGSGSGYLSVCFAEMLR